MGHVGYGCEAADSLLVGPLLLPLLLLTCCLALAVWGAVMQVWAPIAAPLLLLLTGLDVSLQLLLLMQPKLLACLLVCHSTKLLLLLLLGVTCCSSRDQESIHRSLHTLVSWLLLLLLLTWRLLHLGLLLLLGRQWCLGLPALLACGQQLWLLPAAACFTT